MRTSATAGTAAVAGLVLTATVLAGCASAGDGSSAANGAPAADVQPARQAVVAAYARTAEVGTAKVTFSLGVQGLGGIASGGLDATGSGGVDIAHRAGRLSVTLSPAGTKVELRYLDRKAYVELPADLTRTVDHGKRWIELDPDAMTPTGPRLALDGLGALLNIRLADLLGDLGAATGPVRELGTATVDGVRTTRYRVSIDVRTLVSRLSSELGPVLRMGASRLAVRTAPVQLWIDGTGRIRRLDTTVQLPRLGHLLRIAGLGGTPLGPIAAPSQPDAPTVVCVRAPCEPGTGASVHVQLTLSHFGTAVHVVAPPADQTGHG